MSHELVLYTKGKGKGHGGHGTVIDDPLQRKIPKRTIDYGSTVVKYLEDCLEVRNYSQSQKLEPHYWWTRELVPPFAAAQNPYDAICCRFVHSSTNKNRAPINVVHWFPDGRRIISGAQSGEMTIWNGFQFHFENILQAHNSAVKAMDWTPDESVLVTGDQLGTIKFWDQFLYNFQTFQGHKDSICDITIAPTGQKFCSCADDSHAKVWDLQTGEEERAFTGHGWDVKCCHWHPTKGLVATGSKDSQIKLWDPRAGEAITTIYCHKNTVTRVKWSPNGQWLASGSRDNLVMLMDIRMMNVRKVFKAHQKEVTALCWHPETDAILASGGYDNNIHFWDTHGSCKPLESLINAHDGPVWGLHWHPLGHLLASGSHDYSTRFWSRARPGDSEFMDLMPKRPPTSLAEVSAMPSVEVLGLKATVFNSGIFAGAPLRREDVPIFVEEKEPDPALNRQHMGLSMGEGASRKGVLDAADFDDEDGEKSVTKKEPPSSLPKIGSLAKATPLGATPKAGAGALAMKRELDAPATLEDAKKAKLEMMKVEPARVVKQEPSKVSKDAGLVKQELGVASPVSPGIPGNASFAAAPVSPVLAPPGAVPLSPGMAAPVAASPLSPGFRAVGPTPASPGLRAPSSPKKQASTATPVSADKSAEAPAKAHSPKAAATTTPGADAAAPPGAAPK